MHIKEIFAREIIDSRGNPTVEADVILESNIMGRASIPSGASTGSNEALELRDHDTNRYLGRGVLSAVSNISNKIAPALVGLSALDQKNIDHIMLELDGSETKKNLGANAILAVSLAVAKAAAQQQNIQLYEHISRINGTEYQYCMPIPMMNILNGGEHADNNVDIQEFMIQPIGAKTFSDALRMGVEIFHQLKSVLKHKGLSISVGDEGGFAPNLASNAQALSIIHEAIEKSGYRIGHDVMLALDCAASEFYRDGRYYLNGENKNYSSKDFVDYLAKLSEQYPIHSIEDGLDENDWLGWQILTNKLGNKLQLVGDDLFVTNSQILQKGIDKDIANSILIKPNQIGTLTETLEAITLAHTAGYTTVISHRSGETVL